MHVTGGQIVNIKQEFGHKEFWKFQADGRLVITDLSFIELTLRSDPGRTHSNMRISPVKFPMIMPDILYNYCVQWLPYCIEHHFRFYKK